MVGWRNVWLVWLAGAACFNPTPPAGAPCGPDGTCPAGLVCELGVCVTGDGLTADAMAGTDDATSADAPPDAAACIAACVGDELVCDSQSMTCALGCSDSDGAHCMQIVPSNSLTWMSLDAQPLVLAGPVHIDTSNGEIRDIDDNVVIRAAGTGVVDGISFAVVGGIGVFAVPSLTIETDAVVRAEGANGLAFLADSDVTIDGVLDLSGGCSNGDKHCAGAGGGGGGTDAAEATGCGKGIRGLDMSDGQYVTHADGGGGAGAAQNGAGGAGGTAAGASCGSMTLVPLTGGSGGGRGGGTDGGDGGGGGGALQITAGGTIMVGATGVIDAGGAGGQSDQGTLGGGGGGGSGGAILLEGVAVNVLGAAVANGGAGGGHAPNTGNGEDGTQTTSAAQGPSGSWGGGNGGTGAIAPTAGRTTSDHGGGGGGGAGRIRVLAPMRDLSGIVSPAAATGTPALM